MAKLEYTSTQVNEVKEGYIITMVIFSKIHVMDAP